MKGLLDLRISETTIPKIDPGEKHEVYVRDDKLTGFALRARRMADGRVKRSFLVIYQERVEGTRKTVKAFIGEWKDPWREAEAREQARQLLAVRGSGQKVLSAKKRRKLKRTIKALVEEFASIHLDNIKPKTAAEYLRLLNKRVLPKFQATKVSEVNRFEIRDWHSEMKKTPYEANRALAVFSKVFAFAVEREWRADNPVIGVKKFPEKPREHWLDQHDLPVFLKELNKHNSPHHELIRFLLVTGWRISEGINLRWDMVDLKRMVANLPDTKAGPQVRALSADAAKLIDRQEHCVGYVFSARSGVQPTGYKQVRLLLRDVCEAAEVKTISPHALRHTAATYAAIAGASVLELKDALGWKSTAMAERYVEKADALSRQGAEKAAGAINIFSKPSAEIRSIEK